MSEGVAWADASTKMDGLCRLRPPIILDAREGLQGAGRAAQVGFNGPGPNGGIVVFPRRSVKLGEDRCLGPWHLQGELSASTP